MSGDSPMRFPPLIETAERRKHIQNIYNDLNMKRVATSVSNGVKSTVSNLYSNVHSKFNKKVIIVFFILFLLSFASGYWLKPNFLLKSNKNKPEKTKSKQIDSKSTKLEIEVKRINYIKLGLLSLLISCIVTGMLYLLRNKVSFIGKLMIEDPLPYL